MNPNTPVTVYVSHSSPAITFRNDVITPIHVGKAISNVDLDMMGDDTGDHISERNKRYCELTAQYWAWKNDQASEYLGFMHYRRFLDFRPNPAKPSTEHGIIVPTFDDDFVETFGLTPEAIYAEVKGYDIVLPEKWQMPQPIGARALNVERQYKVSDYHFAVDFDLARKVLGELYPGDVVHFDKVAAATSFHTTNMFVMKRDMFNRYSEWLFPLLAEIDSRINYANYNVQEARVIGYLAERLLNVFLLKLEAEGVPAKIKTLPRVFLEKTAARPKALTKPETNLPVVSIVASTDKFYVAHMAGLLASVLDNAQGDDFIDFIILDGGLSDIERSELKAIGARRANTLVRFIDMSKQFTDMKVHYYFTRSTFYRLALPNLLPEHERIIFLDTDMTVLRDLSELMTIDLGDNLAAAVPDLIMRTFCAMGARSLDEAGAMPALRYLQEKVGLDANPSSYFQAGLIVFNLDGMRKYMLSERMIADISSKVYWFLDQDVLNKHLAGRVLPLDYRWNTVFIPEDHRVHLSKRDLEAYELTQRDPWVCHFAGIGKPWEGGSNPLGLHYWRYVRNTPWYEMTLIKAARNEGHWTPAQSEQQQPEPLATGKRGFMWRLGSMFWGLFPTSQRKRLMPLAQALDQSLRRAA